MPEDEVMQPGGVTRTEQRLAKLCARSFLRLWSYANPYKDDGHEFCDVLAVFENHVFIFFDREKFLPDLSEDENHKVRWERWKRGAIDAQIKTAHGAERYLRSGRKLFLDAKKQRPFPIPLNLQDITIHKIIVAHGAADACKQFSEDNVSGSLAVSYGEENDGFGFPFSIHLEKSRPVHVLDSNTLPIILNELDTVKDFSNYLDAKTDAISRFDMLSYSGEEDVLADYWLNLDSNNKHYIGTRETGVNAVGIAEGAWERLKAFPQYKATKEANQDSYFWDRLIDRTCDNYLNGELLGDSDLLEQRSAIHEMAKEPRFIRRAIVDLIFEAVKQFPDNPSGIVRHMRWIPSHESGKGYVFLQLWVPPGTKPPAGMDERTVRQEILHTACGAAKIKMPELHTVIGIGIEPPKLSSSTGEDFVLLDCSDWNEEKEKEYHDRNRGFNFFNTNNLRQYASKVTEFVSPQDKKSTSKIGKIGRNEMCPCGSGKKYKRCHGR